jgi:hypothetical protein
MKLQEKSRIRHFLFSEIALAALLVSLLSVTPGSASTPGRLLIQRCQALGSAEVMYCPSAVRIVTKQTGCIILASAPSWAVTIYNPQNHACFRCLRSGEFADQYFGAAGMLYKAKFNELRSSAAENISLLGAPATHITYKSTAKFGKAARKVMRKELLASSAEFWVGKDKLVPPPAAALLEDLYRLPKENGVPLRFDWLDAKEHSHLRLTTAVFKAVDCDRAMCELPKGLRLVKKAAEVVLSEGDLKEMIQDLNAGDHPSEIEKR